jgi:hypothetical protein
MIEIVLVTGSYSSAWKGFKPTQIWAIFSDRVGETLLFAMLFAIMLLLQITEDDEAIRILVVKPVP